MARSSSTTPFLVMALFGGLLGACRKDAPLEPDTPAPSGPAAVALRMEHGVDAMPLAFDALLYSNAAGNAYSVTRLEYYVSEFRLEGMEGTADVYRAGPWYVNGRDSATWALAEVPLGSYGAGSVVLGLLPELNRTNALPPTMEHVNMAWPDPMGGGYHFMKFEGHFQHDGLSSGYAIHLGKDEHRVEVFFEGPVEVEPDHAALVLRFNLNEVFRGPNVYDLAAGNYSMGSDSLMAVLRDNCTTAFTLEAQP